MPVFTPATRLEGLTPAVTHGGDPSRPETLHFTARLLNSQGEGAPLGNQGRVLAAFTWAGRSHPAQFRIVPKGGVLNLWVTPDALPGTGNGRLSVTLFPEGGGDGKTALADIRYDGQSLDVLFLVDNSGSMSENDPGQERFLALGRSLAEASGTVRQAGVMLFSDRPSWLMPWRPAYPPGPWIDSAKAWSKAVRPDGQTYMADAFRFVKQALVEHRTGARKAVVFLTDGSPTTPIGTTAEELIALGIPICTVGLHQAGSKDYDGPFLEGLAKKSGGVFLDGVQKDLAQVYRSMLQYLRPNPRPWSLAPPPIRVRPGMAPVVSWVETGSLPVAAGFSVDGKDWPILALGRSGRFQEAVLNPPLPGNHKASVRLTWPGGGTEQPWNFDVPDGTPLLELEGPTHHTGPADEDLRLFLRFRLNREAPLTLDPSLDQVGRIALAPPSPGDWQILGEGLTLKPNLFVPFTLLAPPTAIDDSRLLLLRDGAEAFPVALTRSPGGTATAGEVHVRVTPSPSHRLLYTVLAAVLPLLIWVLTWAIPRRPRRRPVETR